jgi:hypothetical protein
VAKVNAQQFVEKWARRTKQAQQDYVTGIQSVQQAPGAAAAAKQQTYIARVTESAPKWARKVGAVSLADWQTAATTVGAQRISSGVDKATNKVAAVAAPLLQAVDSARAAVKSMPNATLEDRIARSAEFQRKMAAFKAR